MNNSEVTRGEMGAPGCQHCGERADGYRYCSEACENDAAVEAAEQEAAEACHQGPCDCAEDARRQHAAMVSDLRAVRL